TSGMGLVLGGRARVVLTGHAYASWVDDLATSNCEAEICAGAMAAQELRWLTYLLTDLGEAPHSPPVLYVDNKAMLALCQEHRLEHRTKHIALRYFLARELQQRGQLRLAYVASQANTADVFTMALQPCDHQRFCTVDDSGNCSIASQLCVLAIVLLFGESKCSTHQKRELYVSNITNLRSLDTRYRAACTDAHLLLAPLPMWLTIHCAAVVPRLFDGCAVPHFPTFTASLATAALSVPEETAAVSATGGQKRGKGGRRGGKGGGGDGGGGGGGRGVGGGT
ncbi:unnamed protein product, partial [Closterium sp. NIES-53]